MQFTLKKEKKKLSFYLRSWCSLTFILIVKGIIVILFYIFQKFVWQFTIQNIENCKEWLDMIIIILFSFEQGRTEERHRHDGCPSFVVGRFVRMKTEGNGGRVGPFDDFSFVFSHAKPVKTNQIEEKLRKHTNFEDVGAWL